MTDEVIRVEYISKVYRLGQISGGTLSEDLNRWWARLRSRPDPYLKIGQAEHDNRRGEYIWALKDVSFDVQQGEALGIIGRNGAGKSTLLKILSRVTAPTSGRVKVKGRIASLLEVGTGFHPDLTGRENIFLNGAILGMRRDEIVRKFDEIVDFAEIEQFVDTPVKRYSSGMYVRLAFAVAAHLDPEILVVDEVLAVGDATFQKKCLGKMGNIAKGGRTVLFVSHNMGAIQSFCNRAIWILQGQLFKTGATDEIVKSYISDASISNIHRNWPDIASAPGNEKVRLHQATIKSVDREPHPFSTRQALVVEFEYWNFVLGALINLSVLVRDQNDTVVFNTASIIEPNWHGKNFPKGLFRSTFVIPGDLLNDGVFYLELLIVQQERYVVHREPRILAFEIVDRGELRSNWHGKWPGIIHPQLPWETELLQENIPECEQ